MRAQVLTDRHAGCVGKPLNCSMPTRCLNLSLRYIVKMWHLGEGRLPEFGNCIQRYFIDFSPAPTPASELIEVRCDTIQKLLH